MSYRDNHNKNPFEPASEWRGLFNKTGYYNVPNNLNRYYAEMEITESELLFLHALMAAEISGKGIKIKQTTLAENLGLTEQRIYLIGKSLEQKGYITRVRRHKRAPYRYALDGLHKRLADCIEANPSKGQSSEDYTMMPTFFVLNFGYFREQYGIGPQHFALIALLMMYRNREGKPLSCSTIEKFGGRTTKTVERAIMHLHNQGCIAAEETERRTYRFSMAPFLDVLQEGIRQKGSRGEKAADAGQKVRVNETKSLGQLDKKLGSTRTKSLGPYKENSIKKIDIKKKGYKETAATLEKSAPVTADRFAEKAALENHPQQQEQAHKETAATVSADQESRQEIQAYSTDQAYEKWQEEREKKAEREKEERIEQRIKTFIDDFFTNDNLDVSIIRPAIERDPISRAAYDRLMDTDRVPLRFRFRDDRQAAGEVMSSM